MPLVKYVKHDGTEHKVEVEVGQSVMQGAVDNMIEGIVAECGGCCSCATCHCYVDEAWYDRAGGPQEVEKEMLECTVDLQATSRLSCQISMSKELDGLVVRLPEAQF